VDSSEPENVAQLLADLEPGDLVASTEIIELCEKMQSTADPHLSAALREAAGELKSMITNGPGPDSRKILDALATRVSPAPVAQPDQDSEAESEPRTKEVSLPGDDTPVPDQEVLSSFISEAHDHLDAIEERILRLEKNADPELVDSIFRSIHTIKGTASFLGLEAINSLSHELESALDDVRSGSLAVTGDLVDVLLKGTDWLARAVAVTEDQASSGAVTTDALLSRVPEFDRIMQRVRQLRERREESTPPGEELITDELRERFIAETGDTLDGCERDLLELERDGGQLDLLENVLRAVHTIKGNAGFLGYGVVEELCMETESALQVLQSSGRRVRSADAGKMIRRIDALRGLLSPAAAESTDTGDEPRPLGEVLVAMGEATPDDIAEALQAQDKKLGEILVEQGLVSEDSIRRALSSQGRGAPGASTGPVVRREIRVDTAKLDGLFDLVGELITAESMLMADPIIASRSQDEEFRKNAVYLGKVTRELQQIAMSVRMIPLEGLFNKMRRLVRDLARKSEKPTDIRVTGQDTEMDRNVIEEIADPLVHIIRNAVDHGIEEASERSDAGKPKTGSLSLDAHYEGNEIWITVQDDGRGLDRDKILKRARERDLIDGDVSELSDPDVWKLIFAPGFSTAEKVTEISGRGVGMDVVRRNIEKLRGHVDVSSVKGEGTRVTLRIPLTLAIVDGVSARVGSLLCAFPIADILEFHKPVTEQISGSGGSRRMVRIRDGVIPIIELHDFFRIKGQKPDPAEGILILTRSGTRTAALLVDEIVGYTQVVVKPLPSFFGDRPGVAGCTLLGSGEVGLIVDSAELVQLVLE
jgi:two-component system chemotaxis sensor kinase CheA